MNERERLDYFFQKVEGLLDDAMRKRDRDVMILFGLEGSVSVTFSPWPADDVFDEEDELDESYN